MKNNGKVKKEITGRKVKHLHDTTCSLLDDLKAKMYSEHKEKFTWDALLVDMAREYSKAKELSVDFSAVE